MTPKKLYAISLGGSAIKLVSASKPPEAIKTSAEKITTVKRTGYWNDNYGRPRFGYRDVEGKLTISTTYHKGGRSLGIVDKAALIALFALHKIPDMPSQVFYMRSGQIVEFPDAAAAILTPSVRARLRREL